MTLSEAIEAVGRMISGYPNGNASKSYLGTIGSLLCQYPRMIATECADPLRGVARETKFMPTVADVVAWCERAVDSMRHMVDWHKRSAEQLREREEMENRPPARAEFIQRMRNEMAAAGMPILGDKKLKDRETPQKVMERFNITPEQWATIPDAPKSSGYWQGLRTEAAE